jgi:hypothetical protein
MELFQAGVAGIKRQLDAMDAAATRVLVESTAPNTADRVSVSTTAKEAATSGTSRTGGIEGALVDLRVSKYLAVANMKVLKTGDDMTKELTELVK